MNTGLLDTVMAGVLFAPVAVAALAAGFPGKRVIREPAFTGAASPGSGMGYLPTVMQFLAEGE